METIGTKSSSSFTTKPLPSPTDLAGCTINNCTIESSFYMYRIDLVPNVAYLAFFSASLVVFVLIYATTRRWSSFFVAMALGLISEIIGYIGRLMSYYNQWAETGFLIQAICITVGPVFMSAGIYLCLSRIVSVFGQQYSRVPAAWYPRLFIPCDLVALILQSAGGALAAIALGDGTSMDTGDNIMIGGLSFHVLTLLSFMAISVDFAIAVRRRKNKVKVTTEGTRSALRGTWRFKAFLVALTVATLVVFWRCVFRVAELSRGWTGPVMHHQGYFVWFEGFMVVIAVTAMAIFHPALCFGKDKK